MNILLIISLLSVMGWSGEKPVHSKEEMYKIYSNFVGGKWVTQGKWKGGADFHQEVTVQMELTRNIFTVKTRDYIDSKKFEDAVRNYGIRAWDQKEEKMKFWEFDVFGGIITGEVVVEGNNVYLVYEYPDKSGGTKLLADVWIYVDKNTYIYKVCDFADGKPGKEYLSSTYKRIAS